MSAKVFKFPLGMAFDLRRAATLGAPDAPALSGYGMFGGGAGLPHDVYQRDQLIKEAVAEFASGAFTLH